MKDDSIDKLDIEITEEQYWEMVENTEKRCKARAQAQSWQNLDNETDFLMGAASVLMKLKVEDKPQGNANIPPDWIFSTLRGESVIDRQYQED